MGQLDVLSTGHGHVTIHVDTDPESVWKGGQVVEEMLERGYAIFVEVDGKTERVQRFDPKQQLYYIRDEDDGESRGSGDREPAGDPTHPLSPGEKKRPGRPGRKHRAVPAGSAKATAVGRSAGG